MDITTRSFGSSIIEVTVSDWGGGTSITEDVTNLDGTVDESFIHDLREVANELEAQNEKIKEQTK